MTEVTPRGRVTSLSSDANQAKEWLTNIPTIDDLFTCKSYDELSGIINGWLNDDESESTGTEWNSNATTPDKAPETKNTGQADTGTSAYSNLDDAFADLME